MAGMAEPDKQSQDQQDAAARVKLGRAHGSLTAERVATMPIEDVYKFLQQLADDERPNPPKTDPE